MAAQHLPAELHLTTSPPSLSLPPLFSLAQVYEKDIKSYVFSLTSQGCKLQLPKDEKRMSEPTGFGSLGPRVAAKGGPLFLRVPRRLSDALPPFTRPSLPWVTSLSPVANPPHAALSVVPPSTPLRSVSLSGAAAALPRVPGPRAARPTFFV